MIKSIDLLQQNELFGSLTETELSRLAPLCSDFVAIEDSVVFSEGRTASHLYIVNDNGTEVNKHVATIFTADEAITLFIVEPLNGSSLHIRHYLTHKILNKRPEITPGQCRWTIGGNA